MSSTTKEKLGSVYFNNNDTELSELADDLNSMKIDLQKEAMKQIIASMTIGKDVSPLFPQVVICMRTQNVELKKLIYLYIINYARAKPDITILAVNAFHQDATDKNSPLIRALAVRTMGCIRVNTIVQYLSETLKISLKDEDAYVRKTACFCVSKLFNTCPSLVKEMGFLESLEDLLSDGNAVVVSSALISLMEISILSGEGPYRIRTKMLKKILLALNETNEWGVVYILDTLAYYKPKKVDAAEKIIDAIVPKLTHANPAVIISAVKIILNLLDFLEENSKNLDVIKGYYKKLSNSIITIVKSIPEIQYSLLRSIHVIIQKRPNLLEKDFRYFYIEYNDPIYVKLEKIDILYKLTDEKNFEYILSELKSYVITEFDQEIITKSFKYMGAITYKFPKSLELIVNLIQEIFQHGEAFISNHALIIYRDVLRKYKSSKAYELMRIITIDFAKKINLPEAKAALLYIVGEFSSRIKYSVEILHYFTGSFANENEKVKSQILNAAIKNFVSKPDSQESEEITKYILEKAGEDCENPDLRDRAYIYWRLLENDPDAAREMLMGEKPDFIYIDKQHFEKSLLDDLVENLTNISCLYQKMSTEFILTEDLIMDNTQSTSTEEDSSQENEKEKEKSEIDSNKCKINEAKKQKIDKKYKNKNKIIESKINQNDFDLLGLGDTGASTATSDKNYNLDFLGVNIDIMDIFGLNENQSENGNHNFSSAPGNLFGAELTNNKIVKDNQTVSDVFSDIQFIDDEDNCENEIFPKNTGVSQPKPYKAMDKNSRGKNGVSGLSVSGLFHKENQKIMLGLHLKNDFHLSMNNFSFAISKNIFGINIDYEKSINSNQFYLNSEMKKNIIIYLKIDKNNLTEVNYTDFNIESLNLEIIIRNNLDDFSCKIPLCLNSLNLESGKMNNQNFMEFFKKFSSNKICVNFTNDLRNDITNDEILSKVLEKNYIYLVAKNNKLDPPVYFYSGLIENNLSYILEISFIKGLHKGISVKIISGFKWLSSFLKETVEVIFGTN